MDQTVLNNADYIIVGAGSAGCVLAARLSENPAVKVVLVEAGGPDSSPVIRLPVGYARTLGDPRYDWCYGAGPEPGLGNRTLHYARGKVLGGSSSINGLAWVRGSRADYDAWAARGATGWDWDSVLPYFIKAEDFAPGGPGRGQGGPVKIDFNPGWHAPSEKLVEAGEAMGLPRIADYNVEYPLGLGHAQLNWYRGQRVSAAEAYLKPARGRSNLVVLTGLTVERLIIENGAATGIHIRTAEGPRTVQAAREVILSAGSIGSPLLLEQSGIGDAERLKALGIDVAAHAPSVGENLQDHLLVMMNYRLKKIRTVNEGSSGIRAALNLARYALTRTGLLSGTPTELMGYARAAPGEGASDIQIFGAPMTYSMTSVGGKVKIALDKLPGLSFGMYQCRPKSRGAVHLTDPRGSASIISNYLVDKADQQLVVAGLRVCRQIMAQPVIAQHVANELAPGADVGDDALLAFAKAAGNTAFHVVGSCRMGSDADAVVDPQLRVWAIRRLRVIDASVMPALVGANTHAPTVMIAERAADFITSSSR